MPATLAARTARTGFAQRSPIANASARFVTGRVKSLWPLWTAELRALSHDRRPACGAKGKGSLGMKTSIKSGRARGSAVQPAATASGSELAEVATLGPYISKVSAIMFVTTLIVRLYPFFLFCLVFLPCRNALSLLPFLLPPHNKVFFW